MSETANSEPKAISNSLCVSASSTSIEERLRREYNDERAIFPHKRLPPTVPRRRLVSEYTPWSTRPSQTNLCRAIEAVPGLFLCESFIDAATESALLIFLNLEPWSNVLKRRVIHYGFKYDYKMRKALEPTLPIPDTCRKVAERLTAHSELYKIGCRFPQTFDQLIVNEYVPGQGIGAHIDSPVFGNCIASVSLGAGIVMRFERAGHAPCDLWLPRRSVVVLTGDARHFWTHAIAPIKSDKNHGLRSRRVSLTFRSLVRNDREAVLTRKDD